MCLSGASLVKCVKASRCSPAGMLSAIARSVNLSNYASQGLDLAFIGVLLSLKKFEHFKHFFHFVQSSAECLDDIADLLNCLLDINRRGGLSCGRKRLSANWLEVSVPWWCLLGGFGLLVHLLGGSGFICQLKNGFRLFNLSFNRCIYRLGGLLPTTASARTSASATSTAGASPTNARPRADGLRL